MQAEIQKRIKRLDKVLATIIKANPTLQKQENLAKALGYKRQGTISDYKNIKKYSESKFIKFLERLSFKYDVNPDYIMEGKGTMFLLKRGEVADVPITLSSKERELKIQGMEYAVQILEAQITRLKDINLGEKTIKKRKK